MVPSLTGRKAIVIGPLAAFTYPLRLYRAAAMGERKPGELARLRDVAGLQTPDSRVARTSDCAEMVRVLPSGSIVMRTCA